MIIALIFMFFLVQKQTDYVIYGTAAGSKLTKAQSLGVMTMSEEEFVQEVENAKE